MSITITRLGHQGDGIAEGPVFVPRALPGEIVDGTIQGDTLVKPKIVTPSEHRVKAPCPVYNTCGGCSVQHASDSFVAEWKTGIVRAALEARGLDAPIRTLHTSPTRSRRRAKFSGKRTKTGAIVGFHGRGATQIADADRCLVVTPSMAALVDPLRELTVRLGSRKAEVGFQVTELENGFDLAIDGAKTPTPQETMDLMIWARDNRVIRLSVNGELIGQEAVPTLGPLLPPPGAFLQATAHGEAALMACVSETLGNAKTVVDLFAGCGTFSLPAARKADVHVVEGDRDLTAAAETAWRQGQGLHHMTFETRDLFRRPLIADELNRFDAAIIDPPRAGAEAQTAEILISTLPKIAAVSCNPVTFARDAEALIHAGYRLNWVDVVDQFRWSHHVEIAASFSRD
ncbi:class I SAM-dependent RNA methyltransferase [Shimia ponticola]|uniref:class I SAM-dependent RNA methyltransferase n=1 Tax=Shimia ponticola TaxID=2582893 RepID=UPI0011BE66DB|nr:class I SAM-dependent RNA methyltransferase [Shimia ponticola]